MRRGHWCVLRPKFPTFWLRSTKCYWCTVTIAIVPQIVAVEMGWNAFRRRVDCEFMLIQSSIDIVTETLRDARCVVEPIGHALIKRDGMRLNGRQSVSESIGERDSGSI